MNKGILLSVLLFSLGCSMLEMKIYRRLNSLELQTVVFDSRRLNNNLSSSDDTLTVSVEEGDYMEVYLSDRNDGTKMKLFYFHEFLKTKDGRDSNMQTTYINYDLSGDSICYFSKTEEYLGQSKFFEVDGSVFKVFKQPYWFFTKQKKPNLMKFYSSDFGLLISLSKTRTAHLKEIIGGTENTEMIKLIEKVELDKDFFNLNIE